jgi:membrane-bound serine protease (ClpP class)
MTALWVLSAAMILAIIGIYFLADHLSENRMWKKLSLTLSLSSSKGYVSSVQNLKKYEGKEGNAATVLRPSGKVEVEGTVVDAVSEGGFILQGAAVRVVRAEGNHLVVK